MTGFAAQVRAHAEKADRRTSHVIRSVGLEFLNVVMTGTPVDKGQARFNWFPTKGAPKDGWESFEGGGEAASSAVTMRGLETFTPSNVDTGGVFWITNNIPYIVRLEQGHSTKGQAFFARAVANVDGSIERAAAEARRAHP